MTGARLPAPRTPRMAEATQENRHDAFRAALRNVTQKYGLQYFMVGMFPEADKASLIENLVVTNWPLELVRKYEKTDMFRESRIVAGLKQTILPIASGNLLFARARESDLKTELLGIFYDAGFRKTIGLSLHDADRNHYVVMLSGNREIIDENEIAGLLFDTMKALDCFWTARPQEQDETALTAREIDCLRWSAAGKSSEEIAVILSISAHTVNTYLKVAMRKLNSVNRMQAVAKACRLRLF